MSTYKWHMFMPDFCSKHLSISGQADWMRVAVGRHASCSHRRQHLQLAVLLPVQHWFCSLASRLHPGCDTCYLWGHIPTAALCQRTDLTCALLPCLQELPCGHFMHSHCFGQYSKYNYTCPVCSKSMGDMSVYFRMIDSLTARIDDLPPEYASRRQVGCWSAG